MLKNLLSTFLLFFVFGNLGLSQSISSNSPLCTDNNPTLELKASGGSSYAWAGPNGFSSNAQNPTISRATTANAGTYTCVVDGKSTYTTLVKIGKLVGQWNTSYYVSIATLNVYVSQNSNWSPSSFNFSWTGPNGFTSNQYFNSLPGINKTMQGIYTATITDEFSCKNTVSTNIQFSNPDCPVLPRIVVSSKTNSTSWSGTNGTATTVNVCEGTNLSVSVDTTGFGNVSIQWYKDEKIITNSTDITYAVKSEGGYHAVITKGTCTYRTIKIPFKYSTTPAYYVSSNTGEQKEVKICKDGGYTNLYINSQNSYFFADNQTVKWYKDGVAIPLNSQTITNIQATEEGLYHAAVKMGQCEGITEGIVIKKSDKITNSLSFESADFPQQKTWKFCQEETRRPYIYARGEGNNILYKDGQQLASFSSSYGYNGEPQSSLYTLKTTQGTCTTTDTLRFEYGKNTSLPISTYSYFGSCNNPVQHYIYLAYSTTLLSNYMRWERDGNTFSTGVTYTYPSGSGTYQLKYDNPVTGCTGESVKMPIVASPITERKSILLSANTPKKIQLCKGKGSKIIQVRFSYSNAVWKKDGKIFDGSSYFTTVSEAGKYWYEANNGQCAFSSDTVEVTNEELPKLTLTQSCNKDNTTKLSVNAISGVKYNWYNNNASISSVKDTTYTTTKGGKFIVEAFRNGCVVSSNEVNVGVTISEVVNACNGDSLKLLPSGNVQNSYTWAGPNGFTSNSASVIIPKTNKKNQGIYTLQSLDKTGCTFKTQANVLINDVPAFTLPKTITACAGSDFVFNQLGFLPLTDTTETVGGYSAVGPNKTMTQGITNISSKDAGTYNFTIRGSQGGCTVKASVDLIVSNSADCKSVSILIPSNYSSTVCPEQTLDVAFKTTGDFKTGTVFKVFYEQIINTADGVKTQKFVMGTGTKSPVKITIPKEYYRSYGLKVESEDGIVSAGTQYAYTSYTNNNDVVDATGYGRTSECTSLELKLSNSYAYNNIQWFLNGVALDKQNSSIVTATKTGTYTFKGRDTNYGCNVSFSKDITIGKLQKPVISNYQTELNCLSEVTYMSTTYYPNATYTWRRDGILQTRSGSSINANTAGKYVVEVSKESCKVTSDTAVLIQNPDTKLNINIGSYISNRNNQPITIIYPSSDKSSTANIQYQLFKDNQLFMEGNVEEFPIKDTGKYFFKASKGNCEAVSKIYDYKGLSKQDSVQRVLYFNDDYYYNNKNIQICDSNSIRTIYGYNSLEYGYPSNAIAKRKVIAYRNGKELPAYNSSSPVYPSLYNVPSNYVFYIYLKGGGNYSAVEEITFTDSTKQVFKYDNLSVNVNSVINIGPINPQDVSVCADSLNISGNSYSSGQRPVLFTWKRDGVVVKKSPESSYANSYVVKQPGTYVLETTYKSGCMATFSTGKISLGKMLINIDTTTRSLCEGMSATLSSTYFNGLPQDTSKIYYQWTKDGKDVTNAKGVNVANNTYVPSYSVKSEGIYVLKAQKGKCQGTSNNLVVKLNNVPNSINYVDSVRFCQTKTVELKTTDNLALTYLWEKDGSFLKDANKSNLTINQAGIYRALNRKGECWNYTPKVQAKVLSNILPTATITGSKDINYADTAKVSIAFTSHAPWTFKLSDGKEYTATKSPFEVSLRPQFSTDYTLVDVKNVCGVGTVSGNANIKVLILSTEQEIGVSLNVFPVPTQDDIVVLLETEKPEKMEWSLVNVAGSILQSESSANKNTRHESSISLKSLPEGTYFLRIQAGEKQLFRKIVKIQ
jgi:hypothetical protein